MAQGGVEEVAEFIIPSSDHEVAWQLLINLFTLALLVLAKPYTVWCFILFEAGLAAKRSSEGIINSLKERIEESYD